MRKAEQKHCCSRGENGSALTLWNHWLSYKPTKQPPLEHPVITAVNPKLLCFPRQPTVIPDYGRIVRGNELVEGQPQFQFRFMRYHLPDCVLALRYNQYHLILFRCCSGVFQSRNTAPLNQVRKLESPVPKVFTDSTMIAHPVPTDLN